MSRPRPEDLRGEALRTYETWRSLGLSESAAMREVVEAGLDSGAGADVYEQRVERALLDLGATVAEVRAGRHRDAARRPSPSVPAAESGPAVMLREMAAFWQETDAYWRRVGGNAYHAYLKRRAEAARTRPANPAKSTAAARSAPRRPAGRKIHEVRESVQIVGWLR